MPESTARRFGVLVATGALLLGGCGSESTSATTSRPVTTTAVAGCQTDGVTGAVLPAAIASPPSVTVVPANANATALQKIDEIVGDGAEVRSGDCLVVNYVGVLGANGRQFDSSWDSGERLAVHLGSGNVIPGWDQGIPGMRVGGRRKLVIPPSLAYGAQGGPPDIPPNATLVFVVDAISVKPS